MKDPKVESSQSDEPNADNEDFFPEDGYLDSIPIDDLGEGDEGDPLDEI